MAQSFGQKLSSQPRVATFTTARSLLLVSSGVVRKCEKEGMMTRISKWVTKWGLSPTTRVCLPRSRQCPSIRTLRTP